MLLDLDGTLISTSQTNSKNSTKIRIGKDYLYVRKRPYLIDFLKEASEYFELGIFTSSVQEYADKVIQVTGIAKFVPKHRRFYRDSCEYINGNYMKRITRIEANLRNVLILDNRPEVVLNKKNVLTIRSWEDGEDNELILCVKNLKKIYESFDVRNISY